MSYGFDDKSRDQKSIFVRLVFGYRLHVGDRLQLCHGRSLNRRRRRGGVLGRSLDGRRCGGFVGRSLD